MEFVAILLSLLSISYPLFISFFLRVGLYFLCAELEASRVVASTRKIRSADKEDQAMVCESGSGGQRGK
jgi:hypothetical protein